MVVKNTGYHAFVFGMGREEGGEGFKEGGWGGGEDLCCWDAGFGVGDLVYFYCLGWWWRDFCMFTTTNFGRLSLRGSRRRCSCQFTHNIPLSQ